jgi:hypothetical protein
MREISSNIKILLVYLSIITALFSCTKAATKSSIIEVTSIEIAESEIELMVGKTYYVDAKINPDEAADQTITYSSSDEEVATIDKYADITAKAEGDCTIQLRSVNGITANIDVTVKEKKIEHIIGKWKGRKIYYLQGKEKHSADELIEELEIVSPTETPEEKKTREGNLAGINNNKNVFITQWNAEFRTNNKGTVIYKNKIDENEDRSKRFFADWQLNENKTYNLHYSINDPKLPDDQKKEDANEIDAILTLDPNNKKLASFVFVLNPKEGISLEVQIEKIPEVNDSPAK